MRGARSTPSVRARARERLGFFAHQTTDAGEDGVMKALVYHGRGKRAWEPKPKPTIRERGDAIVRITTST
ncbi:MAG TPA: hypothetical protein VH436_35565, partial [Vicinamibacterales bacterium]